MSSCRSCDKEVGANASFCPYCGVTAPAESPQNKTGVPDEKPQIRKDAPLASQRSTPVSPRAERRTVIRQTNVEGGKQTPKRGSFHEKDTMRARKVPDKDRAAPDNKTVRLPAVSTPEPAPPEVARPPADKPVGPEDFRPTIRRIAPVDPHRKSPLKAAVTDPRVDLASAEQPPPAPRPESVASESSQPVEPAQASPADETIEAPPPSPADAGVLSVDEMPSEDDLGQNTIAIQITPEMLDDLERRAQISEQSEETADTSEEKPKSTLRWHPVKGDTSEGTSPTAEAFAADDELEEEDLEATAAIRMTPEMIAQFESDFRVEQAPPAPADANSPEPVQVETASVASTPLAPQAPAEELAPADPATEPAHPSGPSVEIDNLPQLKGTPDDLVAALGTAPDGLLGGIAYSFRAGSCRSKCRSALRTLDARATHLDAAADRAALAVGRQAWDAGDISGAAGSLEKELNQHRDHLSRLGEQSRQVRLAVDSLEEKFNSANADKLDALSHAAALSDEQKEGLRSVEGQLQEQQKALTVHQSAAKKADAQASRLEENRSAGWETQAQSLRAEAQQHRDGSPALQEEIARLIEQKKDAIVRCNAAAQVAERAKQAVDVVRNENRRVVNSAQADQRAAEKALARAEALIEESCVALGRALLTGPTASATFPDALAELGRAASVREQDAITRQAWESVPQRIDHRAATRGRRTLFALSLVPIIVLAVLLLVPWGSGAGDTPSDALNAGSGGTELAKRYLPTGLWAYGGISVDGLVASPLLKELKLTSEMNTAMAVLELGDATIQSIVVGAQRKVRVVAFQLDVSGDALTKVAEALDLPAMGREFRRVTEVYSQKDDGHVVAYHEDHAGFVKDNEGEGFAADKSVAAALEHVDLNASMWGVAAGDFLEEAVAGAAREGAPPQAMAAVKGLVGVGGHVHINEAVHAKVVLLFESGEAATAAVKQLDALRKMAEGLVGQIPETMSDAKSLAEKVLKRLSYAASGDVVVVKIHVAADTAKAAFEAAQKL